jgi:hypothetical protein
MLELGAVLGDRDGWDVGVAAVGSLVVEATGLGVTTGAPVQPVTQRVSISLAASPASDRRQVPFTCQS